MSGEIVSDGTTELPVKRAGGAATSAVPLTTGATALIVIRLGPCPVMTTETEATGATDCAVNAAGGATMVEDSLRTGATADPVNVAGGAVTVALTAVRALKVVVNA